MARMTKKQQTAELIKEFAHAYSDYRDQLNQDDKNRLDFSREWVKDCQARLRDLGYDVRVASFNY